MKLSCPRGRRALLAGSLGSHRLAAASIATLLLVGASAVAAQQSCTWTLDETLRIGSLNGPDALSPPIDLEVAPSGEILVTQRGVPYVARFDADGRPSGRIGRAGQGPGEFAAVAIYLGWRGDSLWVTGNEATHVFGPDRTEAYQARFRVPLLEQGSVLVAGMPLVDGSYLGRRLLSQAYARYYLADELPLLHFSADGELLDTLALVPFGPESGRVLVGGELNERQVPAILDDHPLYGWVGATRLPAARVPDGSGVLFVGEVHEDRDPATFALLEVAPSGDTLLERTITYEPRPLTSDQADEVRDWYAASLSDHLRVGTPAYERRFRDVSEAMTIAEAPQSPVRRIVAGHDGTIWLLREWAGIGGADRWEVYDERGTRIGVVEVSSRPGDTNPLDPNLNILYATEDEIWGSTTDELDVPYLHRYQVEHGCS